jgi:hypothetical protein
VKLLLAGMPMTPVPRIAGAVFRAATDPDVATSGCPWVLPDDGPVIRVEKEALRAGVYEMLDTRIRSGIRCVLIFPLIDTGHDMVCVTPQVLQGGPALDSIVLRLGTYLPSCAVDRPCSVTCSSLYKKCPSSENLTIFPPLCFHSQVHDP